MKLLALVNCALSLSLLPSMVAARTGKAFPFEYPTGSGMLCGGMTYSPCHPIVAVSIDEFGYGLCRQWVRITDSRNGVSEYGQIYEQEYDGNVDNLWLSYSLYSKFEYGLIRGSANRQLNITWEYMPEGWNP
ncbi:hypothetical protein CC1G_05600 [Coprinopsis cinerea okayama7|uniref:Uncharacterized protein n=1 Tax=Coprinopsis cinerea (strain Okayama-7 / 130 / ATCC MYA-4618 / FGSC 9003) TaxID=240176 RepID=A8P1K7_COPC7|nr:hypothetical protein CC1G_05600 [Coprinopsis cinerea okayama7\|eukprot:XP_001838119.1 hypothetical protein CC1G_05600 [Coprinopsis cinerea okayama7\